MRIAFTAQEGHSKSLLEARFGRAPYFIIHDTLKDSWEIIDNTEAEQLVHGAGPKAAQKLFDAKVEVLVTGIGPGNHARQILETAGVLTYLCPDGFTLPKALEAFENDELKPF